MRKSRARPQVNWVQWSTLHSERVKNRSERGCPNRNARVFSLKNGTFLVTLRTKIFATFQFFYFLSLSNFQTPLTSLQDFPEIQRTLNSVLRSSRKTQKPHQFSRNSAMRRRSFPNSSDRTQIFPRSDLSFPNIDFTKSLFQLSFFFFSNLYQPQK